MVKPHREIMLFLLVGVIATIADFVLYFALTNISVSRNLAKGLSFIGGTYLGYIGNTKVTFRIETPNPWGYLITYFFSLLVNISINSFIYSVWGNHLFGWILATICSATLNFLGLRYFVFARKV